MALQQPQSVQERHQLRAGIYHSKHNPQNAVVTNETAIDEKLPPQKESDVSKYIEPQIILPAPSVTNTAASPQVDDMNLPQTSTTVVTQSAQYPTPPADIIPVHNIIGIKGTLGRDGGLDLHPALIPTYFLLRPGPSHTKTIVPLIPLDLLPEHVDLVGLPRYLSPTHTARMSSVGTHDKPADAPCYNVRITHAIPSPEATKSEDLPVAHSPFTAQRADQPQAPSSPAPSPPALVLEAAAVAAANHHLLPAPRAKQSGAGYCRHYCHHGTCKWGMYCRYQHVMPGTPEGLAEVGLRGYPAWFRAVVFSVQGSGAGAGQHAATSGVRAAAVAAERKRREREGERFREERLARAREAERVEMERLVRMRGGGIKYAAGGEEGHKGEEQGKAAAQEILIDLE
ncbi:hypothetical protein ACHAQA_004152 [Verticillium albo-atrum]